MSWGWGLLLLPKTLQPILLLNPEASLWRIRLLLLATHLPQALLRRGFFGRLWLVEVGNHKYPTVMSKLVKKYA